MSNTETEMDKPATRRELNETIQTAIAPLATKQELAEAIAPLATKQELREAIAPLATRTELEAWGGALNAKIDRVEVDMAQHANAIIRTLRDEVAKQIAAATDTFIGEAARLAGLIDEKYKHVTVDEWKAMAGRVHRLEAAVFPPPKRRRRRAS